MPLDGDLPARLEPLRERARIQRTASRRDSRQKLRALRSAVIQRRSGLQDALAADLGRPATEADLIEYLRLLAFPRLRGAA